MANVTGTINNHSDFRQRNTAGLSDPLNLPGKRQTITTFGSTGTAADQCDLLHKKQYTLTGAVTTLNLYDGSLLDQAGAACPFREVVHIKIELLSTTDAHALILGQATTLTDAWVAMVSNPGTITVRPSTASGVGEFVATAPNTTGYAVTNTSKLLPLNPGADTLTVNVMIVGRSA